MTDPEVHIDVEALERRYAAERDKRLAAERRSQPLEGRLAADPHADPDFRRDPVTEETDVLIVGGGFAGLLAGGRLRELGIERLWIVEKGADFGGTWYWNRYPGAACDVESYIYLPMLEELGYLPAERYSKAPEILAHCRMLAERFGLYPDALFQTAVDSVTWQEEAKRWLVRTDRGDAISARFVISCTGLLSNPKLPAIPGIETFEGHAFHTSRWDYSYTGGDANGGLAGLADKTVGIIGTGSTAIQAIPHLAASAKHLYVFQRTPSSIEIRGNRPTDPGFADTLTPGWQRHRRDNFTTALSGGYVEEDLVGDSWTDIIRSVAPRDGAGSPVADPEEIRHAEMTKMELARRRISEVVRDAATAEALKPFYHYFCKRPCFHDEYLDVFNRPNVTLVDTAGQGIERVTPTGVAVAGREYPLDCLVFATGFDFLTDWSRETGIAVIGSGEVPLAEHWRDGPRTLHGMQTHGFPNFFLMSIAQAGAAVNYVHVADEQTRTIAYTIAECMKRGVETVQPTRAAEDAWVEEVVGGSVGRRAFLEACTPGYYNYEGKRERSAALNDFYPHGPMEYIRVLDRWREDGGMVGLELEPPPSA